ncbi:helix-turn-helix domain-containing protein [Tengunoibacter tsumagoiensis]|uniref:HTH cro/C1-type domain-containing protein n=1 Tax=Tengunoibacter tsumagoiensis TaxID=2014871 RepID=A0A402A992_9CHLR|nr:helix-turn-helix transcriptional regulator [Tengunoibacter tsumagoiensis]GCE15713.1 hypothetical protein KTT_55720 [Tengunoibacter tsumagoiensis]
MSGKDAKLRPPSALSRALKKYRDMHKYTQEELARLLDEDTRQVRRWENNETLIHSGDLRNGEPLAVEAALYSKEHGHFRRLERLYVLKRYVNRQMLRYGKTELALSEALEGAIEDR